MSSYDDILRTMREADHALAPLREFERLYGRSLQKVTEDFTRRNQLFRAALPELSTAYRNAIECLQPALDQFRGEFARHSPALALIADAHSDLSRILHKQPDLEPIARAIIAVSPQWQEAIAPYQRLGRELDAAGLAIKSHYATVAESAFLAQERLLRVPWDSLGSATKIDHSEFSGIRDHFTRLAETYRSLVQSFETDQHFVASFPPIISGGPPLEILTSARILDSLSRPIPEQESFEVDRMAESAFEDEIEASTDELLAAFDPGLRAVWLGAKEALRSANPDRGRHVVVSLRELVTHVLDIIAPNDEIQTWTSDPSHFHDGRPTREARVLFVCRGVNNGPFQKFVSTDVRATTEFIRLFQRGTHELAVSFSETQLRALVTRTESLLRFLLLTSRATQ